MKQRLENDIIRVKRGFTIFIAIRIIMKLKGQ